MSVRTTEDVVDIDGRVLFFKQLPSTLNAGGGIYECSIHIEKTTLCQRVSENPCIDSQGIDVESGGRHI